MHVILVVLYLILLADIPEPNLTVTKPNDTSVFLSWEYNDRVCYYNVSFPISWCTVENGVPDVSTCNSTTTFTTDITLSNLVPSTTYQVNITAQSVEYIRSDPVEMEVTTLGELCEFYYCTQ